MAYVRMTKSKEELSRVRAEAGRRGAARRKELGHNSGGRPKGALNQKTREATHVISIRETSYRVFMKCAGFMNKTLIEFMGDVANGLKEKNPELFDLKDSIRM